MTKDEVEVLELSNAQEIAKTISNSTAKKILDFIQENNDCTASHIKESLNLPASTISYNLKALIKAKIIDDSTFHYSSKGKEVIHYNPTSKVIIIVPKKDKKNDLLNRLNTIIPGILTTAFAGVVLLAIRIFKLGTSKEVLLNDVSSRAFTKSGNMAVEYVDYGYVADEMVLEAAASPQAIQDVAVSSANNSFLQTILSVDFLIGFGICLGLILIITTIYILIKRKKKI